ncbi:hypothetical protein PTKIN_Ptkin07bG0252500 [Pterospermum kingtungense]
MARLGIIRNAERRKRIVAVLTIWLEMCVVVSWFLIFLSTTSSLHTYRPRIRSYSLDFYAKRDYVRRLLHDSDESCISQLRMNRAAFFKLCEMLKNIGGLKSTRNMLIDEQRSGETISRHFHNVLNAVMHLQDHLFKKPEPIPTNSTDNRWKWFKNCLGALDGTYIKVKVPLADKPRYRTRKGDIATNMLGVCTPNLQFVYVLPGWEGSVADSRVLRDAITRRHGLKVPNGKLSYNNRKKQMSRNASTSPVDSQTSKRTNRKWSFEEDVVLVSCMVDLHNMGTHNADTGFKAGYLLELERMVGKKLPSANIKAKPHIESRIKTLKKDWSIIFDMVQGNCTSGFGWDSQKNMVTAEDAVWESYITSHKDAAQFRTRSFCFYNELSHIYAKDRATGQDAQTAADILEDIALEENVEINEGTEHENQFELGSDDMDISSRVPQTSTSSRRKRKASEIDESISAATLLGDKLYEIADKLSDSIGSERVLQQKVQELYGALGEIEGLAADEMHIALSKIPDHPTQMLVFFSLPPSQRLGWVQRFLTTH